MIRLPDRAYRVLERVYRAQARMRREELCREVARQDAALRTRFARELAAHNAGLCGSAEGGCRYYPCYSVEGRSAS